MFSGPLTIGQWEQALFAAGSPFGVEFEGAFQVLVHGWNLDEASIRSFCEPAEVRRAVSRILGAWLTGAASSPAVSLRAVARVVMADCVSMASGNREEVARDLECAARVSDVLGELFLQASREKL